MFVAYGSAIHGEFIALLLFICNYKKACSNRVSKQIFCLFFPKPYSMSLRWHGCRHLLFILVLRFFSIISIIIICWRETIVHVVCISNNPKYNSFRQKLWRFIDGMKINKKKPWKYTTGIGEYFGWFAFRTKK